MIQDISPLDRIAVTEVARGARDKVAYRVLKRTMDIVFAVLLLIAFAPVFLLIAVLIRLETRGPVIFTQERVGARQRWNNGAWVWEPRIFKVYKFRSMYHNTDPALHQAYIKSFITGTITPEHDGPKFKLRHDPRITRVGAVIRKTSLDELPQLFNVLKGDMSLVGPRPVPTYEVEQYQPEHYHRLAALPGITGLWQVRGRGEVTFEEMIAMDVEYIERQSLWLDLKLLLLTIPAVFRGRGAN